MSARPSTPCHPTPQAIIAARTRLQLTQTEAGALIYASLRAWQDWEGGKRRMPPAAWEYFCLLCSSPTVRAARARWRSRHG